MSKKRRFYLSLRRTIKTGVGIGGVMLGSIVVVLAPSLLPGWALSTVLDGSSDRFRKALLAPALGLLVVFGISGLLLLLNIWSPLSMLIALLGANVLAWKLMNTRHEVLAQRTRWQMLEAAMHGEISQQEDPALSKEASTQLEFRRMRKFPLYVVSFLIASTALLPPLLQRLPFGVDWIGFAMLTQQVALEGNLSLPGTNQGFWTYPPAFPSLAAWISVTASIDAATAVFHLGHYSLFVLLIGLMGAFDRHGAGAYGMFGVGLGLGLFAKTFDSGYPSVASQLGLIVGVLVLLRPTHQRQRHHTLGVMLALICVGLIHPTGAIYLAALMLCHVLHGIQFDDEDHQEMMRKFAMLASAFITVGFTIALVVIAPRLFDEAVFSEYGWQGGKPMLVYNGFLLIVASFAGWSLRNTLEGRIALTWFASLWLLSTVHLVEGLEHIPILSLLSYTLYSMALHAFHIPLAVLVVLWWSPTTQLSELPERPLPVFSSMPAPLSVALMTLLLLGTLFAQNIAFELSTHDELFSVTPGDLTLREELEGLDAGVVYTENMHWGYIWNAPNQLDPTSIPTLGLVHLTGSEQSNATRAIFNDNASYFLKHNMRYAITSPLGSMQWTLATSPLWAPMIQHDGAVLWAFNSQGDAEVPELQAITIEDCPECTPRLDPWRDHRFRDPLGLGDDRPFLIEGTPGLISVTSPSQNYTELCVVYETVGLLEGIYLKSESGLVRPFQTLNKHAGYHRHCMNLMDDQSIQELNIEWEATQPSGWINPLGLSGRDSVMFDNTGVRLHWLEWSMN
ncbi:hypothetical protein N9N91_00405 [Candidatus Poseidonia alphae]|nr:hypothetical protein [Candidatus Poseidonia alphae]